MLASRDMTVENAKGLLAKAGIPSIAMVELHGTLELGYGTDSWSLPIWVDIVTLQRYVSGRAIEAIVADYLAWQWYRGLKVANDR